jgi:hypothetical protein
MTFMKNLKIFLGYLKNIFAQKVIKPIMKLNYFCLNQFIKERCNVMNFITNKYFNNPIEIID